MYRLMIVPDATLCDVEDDCSMSQPYVVTWHNSGTLDRRSELVTALYTALSSSELLGVHDPQRMNLSFLHLVSFCSLS